MVPLRLVRPFTIQRVHYAPPPSSEMRIKKIIRTKVNTAYRLQMSMQYDTEEKLLNVTVHQAVVHGKSWSLY